jgi:hypothetical protein
MSLVLYGFGVRVSFFITILFLWQAFVPKFLTRIVRCMLYRMGDRFGPFTLALKMPNYTSSSTIFDSCVTHYIGSRLLEASLRAGTCTGLRATGTADSKAHYGRQLDSSAILFSTIAHLLDQSQNSYLYDTWCPIYDDAI